MREPSGFESGESYGRSPTQSALLFSTTYRATLAHRGSSYGSAYIAWNGQRALDLFAAWLEKPRQVQISNLHHQDCDNVADGRSPVSSV
jgi:hypothetical protein